MKQKNIFRWFWKNTGKNKYGILVVALFRAIISGGSVLFAILLKNVIDSAVQGKREDFLWSFFLCGMILVIQDGLCAIEYHLSEKISFQIEKNLKVHMYHRLLMADYRHLKKWHTGELMNYLNGDVGIVSVNMISIVSGISSMCIKLVFASAVLILWDWRFCLVFLLGGIIIFFLSLRAKKIMRKMHKDVRESYGKLQAFQQESMENVMMIRTFQAEERAEKMLKERLKQLWKVKHKKNFFSNLFHVGFEGTMDLGYLFGVLWCGYGILQGTITFGEMTAMLQLIGQIQQPFSSIASYLPQYYAMVASAERLMELEEIPLEEYNEDSDRKKTYQDFESIQIKNLTFAYDNTPVLNNASLIINKFDTMGFIGVSGIGKSTLLKLLLAFYKPDYGEICFVGKNEEKEPVSSNSRKMFAYVPQGNYLMSGSIYEIVSFLRENEELTNEEKRKIKEACRIACADSFIKEMPAGYDSVIGEGGVGVSEGQMQRLAIARAIYTDAPVLLLDEATSALDEKTEQKVLENLKEIAGKTILIITHRKQALSICNRIITVSDMKFKECLKEK